MIELADEGTQSGSFITNNLFVRAYNIFVSSPRRDIDKSPSSHWHLIYVKCQQGLHPILTQRFFTPVFLPPALTLPQFFMQAITEYPHFQAFKE
ncbi:MAG TPA: hypothetical protein VGU61_02385 [Noviherbaspirillum sp.]|uniref:hypothetical protein n=1 Tax=Noviherbaspirillum sp. TaxID=1926288 RepID=UPI002DDD36DF|nr:hypothetical protein [Noviherbaspirillum sp.]HEV2609090.1 hypothetical protein [Noviherbaspirillum sp.]